MSTGELDRLQRVERLLERAMDQADHIPVDLTRGRSALAPYLEERRHAARRRWVICVAASVLAVAVTAAIVLAGLRDHHESLPVSPAPGVTLSPSGLPVGRLTGKIDRSEPGAESTVRIDVHSDGSGVFNAGTVGDSTGDSTADYVVELAPDGPGRAVMSGDGGACYTSEQMTLVFTVRGRTVVIEDVLTTGCLVPRNLAIDMTGVTLRLLPLEPGT